MSEVGGVSGQRHFSNEEEEALRRDESTNTIVKRDTNASVNIYGLDRSWEKTKEHQRGHLGVPGAAELVHAGLEGAEIAGFHLGVAGAIGLPAIGLGLGIYKLLEARVDGEEQARALQKETVHVALIGTLDLPDSYKEARFTGEYKGVSRDEGTPAKRMMDALYADPKGRAVLQLHADRGMNAARDMLDAKVGAEAFWKVNPKLAESYAKDAAFREGFDAYLQTKAYAPMAEAQKLDAKLDARNLAYVDSAVRIRG